MDKVMPPETAERIDLANIAVWLELQEQRIARLEAEVVRLRAEASRAADPHRKRRVADG